MTKRENKLATVQYTARLTDKFTIGNDLILLLNSISVYGVIEDYIDLNAKVDFEIKVINGKKIIYPLDVNYDSYVLFCERLVFCSITN